MCTPYSMNSQFPQPRSSRIPKTLVSVQTFSSVAEMGVLPYKFQRLFKKVSFNNDEYDHRRYEKLGNGDHQKQSRSPRGFIPIYVGEERKRYIVPTAATNSAAFKAMLDKYQDDITPFGPLEVPCSVAAFDHVLRRALDQTLNSKRRQQS